MKNCVQTFVILAMSVVLMGMTLILMHPYGMVGIATAFTIAGVYIALMVLIVTVGCCSRRDGQDGTDVEQTTCPGDAPPPYDQVVTKPPSYKTLFFPPAQRILSVFTQNPSLISTTESSAYLKTVVGLPNDLTPSLSVGPYGVLPPRYSATDSTSVTLESEKTGGLNVKESPLAAHAEGGSKHNPSPSPESRPRTPRRVRFMLSKEDDKKGEEPAPRKEESPQETDDSIS